MRARHPISCAWAALGLVLALGGLLGLPGCGDDPAPQPGEPEPGWSDPAADGGVGHPDGGTADGVTSAETLLARLRKRVAEGKGHTDPTFERLVGDMASVLWEPDAQGAELEAARVHMQVANIAGEVGRWLAASASARAERSKSHPTDVALFDAFLAATAAGPESYRTWCGEEGARLLKAHADAQYRRHFPQRFGEPK